MGALAATKPCVGCSRQVDKHIVGLGPLRHPVPCHNISLDLRAMAPGGATRHVQPRADRGDVRITGEQQQRVAGMSEQFMQADRANASHEVTGVAHPV